MKKYIIEEENLRKLFKSLSELWALECAGVDNWQWYDEALSLIHIYKCSITVVFALWCLCLFFIFAHVCPPYGSQFLQGS